jgi:membrane associated rhomboid family serine protease
MVDRPFLRPGGALTPAVIGLGLGLVTALLVMVFWGSEAYPDALGLVPRRAYASLELWRLVTAPLYLGELDTVRIAPVVLGLFALYLLGTPLERWLGTVRVLVLFFSCTLVGPLVASLLGLAVSPDQPLGGPSPGIWGLVTAAGLIFWHTQVWILRPLPVRGRHVFLGLVVGFAISVVLDLVDGTSVLHALASLVGGGVGALFVTRGWRFWQRQAPRARFVLVPGGAGGAASTGRSRGGNGNGHGEAPHGGGARGPRQWN